MYRFSALLIILTLLNACEPQPVPPITRKAPQPAAQFEPQRPLPAPIVQTRPPIAAARVQQELPKCPGMDIRRPAGSNCYGIMPTACGADKANTFVGRKADANIREQVASATGTQSIRWIKPGEPVIQNLDPGRLNMELDAAGRIRLADCY